MKDSQLKKGSMGSLRNRRREEEERGKDEREKDYLTINGKKVTYEGEKKP